MRKLDSYRLYIGTSFFHRLCWSMMTTISLVFMVTVAGLDPLQMVLVGTVLELSAFVFEIPTGIVADVYSRKRSIIIGYITVGFGYMLLGLFPRFEVILLSSFIWGIGWTFLSGASQAWITDEIGEERANHSFVVASQFANIGGLFGIGFCLALAVLDMSLPIIVGSLGLIMLGVFDFFFMAETSFKPLAESSRNNWQQMGRTFTNGIKLISSRPMLKLVMLIALFEGLYSEGFDRLYAPFLIESFEFPSISGLDTLIWWGVMSAGATLFSLLALEVIRRLIDTSNYRHLVLGLTIITSVLIATMVIFALSANFYLAILAYFAIMMLRTVKEPLANAWLNQNLESESRATIFSMHAQADAAGQIGGGPLVGMVGKFISIPMALIASTCALLPTITLYIRAIRKS